MDLKHWIPLWKAEPGLRPKYLTHNADPHVGHPNVPSYVGFHWYGEPIDDKGAAALQRDAAITWLCAKRAPGYILAGALSDDPTLSLYRICCEVQDMEPQE